MSQGQLTSEYRTASMALAVYLNLEGHCHQRLEMRQGKAVWVFLVTDELTELVNDFQLDVSLVPPRAFIEELSRCRNEMYDFLGRDKPNARH